jgi:choline dehydrogenase
MENYPNGDDLTRGHDGPLGISEAVDESPLYDALFAAGAEVGLARNPDYNGADQEGMGKTQTTIRNGRRMSAAYCYLRPARNRANLTVHSQALAQALILDGRRCVGVRYRVNGQLQEARAAREVIVSAGAINSPQLLELSGIGRPEVLKEHGIEINHALPGVGENLRDHIAPRLRWKITRRGVTYNDRVRGLGLTWQVLRYALTRKGFLALPSGPVLAFLRTRAGLATPDIQLHFVPFSVVNVKTRELGKEPGITVACYQLRPESTGSIHIQSADAQTAPAIRFNFLTDEIDRTSLLGGMRWTRRIIGAHAMDDLRGEEERPGANLQSDDELLDWVRQTAETAYHPVGTCKMGQDKMAVVDDQLRVHGIAGLRVADGSIMPTLVSGNTNAACIMIGEKAADLILQTNG